MPREAHGSEGYGGRVLIEACVEDVSGALLAEETGAGRLELCAALSIGGITPSIGMVESVLQSVRNIGVQVMIRPRGGDYHYSRAEQAVMLADVTAVLALDRPTRPVSVGFVVGALTDTGDIDESFLREFVNVAEDNEVTFHKAFDDSRDLFASLDVLSSVGVTRILTSGGQPRAMDGADFIADLVRRSGQRVTIMAGGGVRSENVVSLIDKTRVTEVHLRGQAESPTTAGEVRRGRLEAPVSLIAGVHRAVLAGRYGG